ncbi:serine hydrolase domain-containing protein [Streptomyces sp. NBC_00448]|uniref:serine hydrolase domain-containing protein n=1 Tax=Streptomyces sp. NBC_00448 TaxID=2903652 RepID=UPI002E1B6F2B
MPSVVGLLEQHELAARRRVDGLREEADRIQAELAAAESEWQQWTVARRRVDAVLAPGAGTTGTEVTSVPVDADLPSPPGDGVKPRSQVPMWREGLARSVLSVDYQRIVQVLADRSRLPENSAAGQDRPELQKAIQEIVDSGLAGVSLRVNDERGEWVGSAGVAELGEAAKPPVNGYVRIGSNTKTFTATLVLQLVAEGKIELDTAAADYLPEFGLDRRITVRMLLQHTSGVFNFTGEYFEDRQDGIGGAAAGDLALQVLQRAAVAVFDQAAGVESSGGHGHFPSFRSAGAGRVRGTGGAGRRWLCRGRGEDIRGAAAEGGGDARVLGASCAEGRLPGAGKGQLLTEVQRRALFPLDPAPLLHRLYRRVGNPRTRAGLHPQPRPPRAFFQQHCAVLDPLQRQQLLARGQRIDSQVRTGRRLSRVGVTAGVGLGAGTGCGCCVIGGPQGFLAQRGQ